MSQSVSDKVTYRAVWGQLKITNQDDKYALKIKIKNQDGEYAYTYETDDVQWTPLNSNLQMQGIKVILSKQASYLSFIHH